MATPEWRAKVVKLQAEKLGMPASEVEQWVLAETGVETKAITGLPENWKGYLWQHQGAFNRMLVSGLGADDGEKLGGAYGFSGNSAVYACINTVATAYKEARRPFVFRPMIDEGPISWEVLADHPIYRLLRKPNVTRERGRGRPVPGEYPSAIPWVQMMWLCQWWKHVDGTAYLLKVRSGHPITGNVVELWPVGPDMMKPVTFKTRQASAANFIDYYAYAPFPDDWDVNAGTPSNPLKVDVRNVVKLTKDVDPLDTRLGLGPVKFLAREVTTDERAEQFTNILLKNYAMPGMIVIPEEGYINEEDATEMRDRLQALLGLESEGTGKIAFLSGKAKVQEIGFDPDRMSLAMIHRHVEQRIGAVMNVPAMVAQLGAGLEQASQFTNFHEAREMFSENSLLPLLIDDGEALTEQLFIPDFPHREGDELRYDIDGLRALQKDITERFGRLQVGVKGGWLTANEARAQVRLPPIDRKTDEVPLTQGQDNRLNTLLEKGGITINEARESVGLPPTPGGEHTLGGGEIGGPMPDEGSPADRLPPPDESKAPDELPIRTKEPNRGGADLPPRSPRSPTSGQPEQKSTLQRFDEIVALLGPDELHRIAQTARAEGTTLAETLSAL